MAKPEWGVKRLCPNCAARFYDLMRDPIVCPSCETSFSIDVFTKPRRGKSASAAAPKAAAKVPAAAPADEEEVLETAEDSDDDDVLDLDDDDAAGMRLRRLRPKKGRKNRRISKTSAMTIS